VADHTYRIFLPGEFEEASGLIRLRAPQPEAIGVPGDVMKQAGPTLFVRMAIPSFTDAVYPPFLSTSCETVSSS